MDSLLKVIDTLIGLNRSSSIRYQFIAKSIETPILGFRNCNLTLFRVGSFVTTQAAPPPPCFSFICGPITTKLSMMILWDKISQKPLKNLLTSLLGGKYDVIKPVFFVSFQVKIRASYRIFCPMELKFGTGVNSEALISNSSQKIRYKYVLKEKRPFLRKTKIFAQALFDKSVAMATP